MRVENLLTIFGILVVIAGYAAVIVAFGFIQEDRNMYLLSGIGAVLSGTMMLGIAKAINQQADVIHHMDDLRRLVRNHVKIVNDMRGASKKATSPQAANTSKAAAAAKTTEPAAKPAAKQP